jgi:hypothetical protein
MVNRKELCTWIIEALKANNGSASIVEVCKYIWDNYENELRKSANLFFRWQYDVGWAATQLRKEGVMRPKTLSPKGICELIARALKGVAQRNRVSLDHYVIKWAVIASRGTPSARSISSTI